MHKYAVQSGHDTSMLHARFGDDVVLASFFDLYRDIIRTKCPNMVGVIAEFHS